MSIPSLVYFFLIKSFLINHDPASYAPTQRNTKNIYLLTKNRRKTSQKEDEGIEGWWPSGETVLKKAQRKCDKKEPWAESQEAWVPALALSLTERSVTSHLTSLTLSFLTDKGRFD